MYTLSRSWFLVLRAQPPVPDRSHGGEERKTHQSTSSPGRLSPWFCFAPHLQNHGKAPWGRGCHQRFSETNDKENQIRKHIREKRIRETGLFYILSSRNHAGGIFLTQYVALYSFHTWLSKL